MSTTVTWLVVLLTGGSLLLILACTKPSEAAGNYCAIDYNASGYIDTSDIAQLTGRFGLPAAEPYDVAPPPNGYVDTADIIELTGVFGNECYETSGEEEVGEFANAYLFGCQWRTWHFPKIKDTNSMIATIATKAQTTCISDFPALYRSECFTGTEVKYLSTDPNWPNYYVAGASAPFAWPYTDDCYANTGPFQVPMGRNIRDFVHHAIIEVATGRYVHGPHDHHAQFDTAVLP